MKTTSRAKAADPNCPTCAGRGFVIRKRDDGTEAAGYCACRTVATPEDRCAVAGLPDAEIAKAKGPVDGQVKERTEALLKYIQDGMPDSVLLVGPVGTGKSVLAARLMLQAALCHPGWSMQYFFVPDWITRLKQTYSRDHDAGRKETETEAQVLDMLEAPDLVVLDDLGAEHSTPWTVSMLTAVIHKRYVKHLRTLVTSNYDRDCQKHEQPCGHCLYHRYDDRVASRMASYVIYHLDGVDLRQRYRPKPPRRPAQGGNP